MKSIRLSLIVYFLVLIAVALGGVSVLAFRTTWTTLQDKQASTEDLIHTQFTTQCRDIRGALDRRLLHQAQLLASKARSMPIPREPAYLAIAAGIGAGPTSRATTALWIAPALTPTGPAGDPLANHMSFRLKAGIRLLHDIQIPAAAVDYYMPADEERPLEVFQTWPCNVQRPSRTSGSS